MRWWGLGIIFVGISVGYDIERSILASSKDNIWARIWQKWGEHVGISREKWSREKKECQCLRVGAWPGSFNLLCGQSVAWGVLARESVAQHVVETVISGPHLVGHLNRYENVGQRSRACWLKRSTGSLRQIDILSMWLSSWQNTSF